MNLLPNLNRTFILSYLAESSLIYSLSGLHILKFCLDFEVSTHVLISLVLETSWVDIADFMCMLSVWIISHHFSNLTDI